MQSKRKEGNEREEVGSKIIVYSIVFSLALPRVRFRIEMT